MGRYACVEGEQTFGLKEVRKLHNSLLTICEKAKKYERFEECFMKVRCSKHEYDVYVVIYYLDDGELKDIIFCFYGYGTVEGHEEEKKRLLEFLEGLK